MTASRAKQASVAERRSKLIKMRLAGKSFDECAAGLGYSSKSAATKDFSRALEGTMAEQSASREVYREVELLRLDEELDRLNTLYERTEVLLDRENVAISAGRVVLLDSQPVPDDGPYLQIIDRLLRIEEARRRNGERRAKLMGLEAAQRVEVLTIDDIDANIRRLNEQLAALDGEADEAAGTAAAAG